MKRKFKLFATIASLCLCLALMAFGVYAASNLSYKATSSVKFEISDVFATVHVEMASTVGGVNGAAADKRYKSYDESDGAKAGNDELKAKEEALGAIVFTKSGDKVTYTLTLTNDGASPITAGIQAEFTNPNDKALKVDLAYDNAGTAGTEALSGVSLASGKSVKVTLTITLLNMEYQIEETPVTLTVTAAK